MVKKSGLREENHVYYVTVLERSVWAFSVLHNINPMIPPILIVGEWGTVGTKGEKVGF